MSGRPTTRDAERRAEEVERVGERIGRHFSRSEPRRRAVGYVRALLGDAGRKNGWQPAEPLGEATPAASSACPPGPTGTPTPSATT